MARTCKQGEKPLRISVALIATGLVTAGSAFGSTLVSQTPVPGDCLPQFQVELPVFGPAGPISRVDTQKNPVLTVKMKQIEQQVIPVDTKLTKDSAACREVLQNWPKLPKLNFGETKVWVYETSAPNGEILGPAHWPAVTLENLRGNPITVTFENDLPHGPGSLQNLITVDQTIHWADPLNPPMPNMMGPCMDNPGGTYTVDGVTYQCSAPYQGPVPTVPHLHGGEISSKVDGGPLAWFTPDGRVGSGYYTLGNPGPGKATYRYPNDQEGGTLWFHDHALGATRTNVYSGLEAFYFLRDKKTEPQNLPSGKYEIELAIQDRQFDTNGQLFFPDGASPDAASLTNLNGPPGNPAVHPFWIPEFLGDVAVVNGAPWPYLKVEPRRYLFRLLDGSNARIWNLRFGGVPIYKIGADDNYFDAPVPLDAVNIAPGERAYIIADFTQFSGQTITVTNDQESFGQVPGQTPDQVGMANVLQFRVAKKATGSDSSCNPALGECTRSNTLVRLTDGNGGLAPGVVVDKKRQLVLKEFEDPTTGEPVMVLVNNTFWDGTTSPSIQPIFPTDGISELPRQGSIEQWEIINLTMDPHPIHLHLTQFQLMSRQDYDQDGTQGSGIAGGYSGAWGGAFPACENFANPDPNNPCPGFGPPQKYNVPNEDGALGGNPAISPFLLGSPQAPPPEEFGWKDTIKAYPNQVTRILVRWTPTSVPVNPKKSSTGKNFYSFDPTEGDGYVWHCHIIDHEDNEMMRPYKVTK